MAARVTSGLLDHDRWRTRYVRMRKRMPVGLSRLFDPLADWAFFMGERLRIRRSLRSGPPFRPSRNSVIIDITTLCNRQCIDCNRSVGKGQAMTREHMSIGQIRKFIAESIEQDRRWARIDIEGGEPTLHPLFYELLECLAEYRDRHSPASNIRVLTNGHGKKAGRAIGRLRALGIDVYDSRKTTQVQEGHCAFNLAPCDGEPGSDADFSGGCHLPAVYGLGLTRHGYYPHPVCGGIDRVFGMDIGRKSLPQAGDDLADQYSRLCRYCGFYTHSKRMQEGERQPSMPECDRGRVSASWRRAYSAFRRKRPDLTVY